MEFVDHIIVGVISLAAATGILLIVRVFYQTKRQKVVFLVEDAYQAVINSDSARLRVVLDKVDANLIEDFVISAHSKVSDPYGDVLLTVVYDRFGLPTAFSKVTAEISLQVMLDRETDDSVDAVECIAKALGYPVDEVRRILMETVKQGGKDASVLVQQQLSRIDPKLAKIYQTAVLDAFIAAFKLKQKELCPIFLSFPSEDGQLHTAARIIDRIVRLYHDADLLGKILQFLKQQLDGEVQPVLANCAKRLINTDELGCLTVILKHLDSSGVDLLVDNGQVDEQIARAMLAKRYSTALLVCKLYKENYPDRIPPSLAAIGMHGLQSVESLQIPLDKLLHRVDASD